MASLELFRFKLDEIDNQIDEIQDYFKGDADAKRYWKNQLDTSFGGGQGMCRCYHSDCRGHQSMCQSLKTLREDKQKIIIEMGKEAQFISNQAILQEREDTLQEMEATAKAKAEVLKALAEVQQANTLVEKMKAEAALEAARTKAALTLSKSSEGRGVLLGQERKESVSKPLVYAGILIGAFAIGFGIYKIIK